jgi:methionine-S-sulfoxide reductase
MTDARSPAPRRRAAAALGLALAAAGALAQHKPQEEKPMSRDETPPAAAPAATSAPLAGDREVAVLAGGCFWGMEELLRKIPGVLEVEVGYTGGHLPNPRYEDTHESRSGHAEAVRVVFDPKRLPYPELLEKWFFRMHDPTTPNRQGNDVGTQYRSAIFYADEAQRAAAEAVKARVQKSGHWKGTVVTEIAKASTWYRAEDYHQDYLQKHPGGYSCHFLRPW